MEITTYWRGKLEGKRGKNFCEKLYFQARKQCDNFRFMKVEQNNFFMYPGFSGTPLWVVSKGKKLSCQAISKKNMKWIVWLKFLIIRHYRMKYFNKIL